MRSACAATIVSLVLAIHFLPAAAEAHGAARVVIDTDMGIDDARALFALLAGDALDIEAVVVTEGSASSERGIENLLGLLEAAGAGGIPVFEGARLGEAPPWRETANSLGGFAMRGSADRAPRILPLDSLAALLERGGDVDYLALGPLGSVAALFREHEEAASGISTVFLPARVKSGEVSSWNLTADRAGAKTVFESAREIVLVGLPAEGAPADPVLRALRRETPAARFARNTLSSHGGGPHAFLCDEMAAARMLRPSIAPAGEETFLLELAGDAISLEPAARGNVRVAHFDDLRAAAEVLAGAWEHPPRPQDETAPGDIPVAKLLASFHGHLGPYVVLGYRMGRAALEAAGCAGHFDVSAEIHSFLEPPRSCLIDGVQLGTGCTLGKRNIEVFGTDGPAWGVFTAKSGSVAVVRVLPGVPALVDSLIRTTGVEGAGKRLLDARQADLFTIETRGPGEKR